MKHATSLVAAAATVATYNQVATKSEESKKNQPGFVSSTKTTSVAHVSVLFLGSVSPPSPPKRFIFLLPRSLVSLSLSVSFSLPSPEDLSVYPTADYYATATITFPRRHPLSWLFASLRSTRRNYLANSLKERKRRETWALEGFQFSSSQKALLDRLPAYRWISTNVFVKYSL